MRNLFLFFSFVEKCCYKDCVCYDMNVYCVVFHYIPYVTYRIPLYEESYGGFCISIDQFHVLSITLSVALILCALVSQRFFDNFFF